MVGLGNCDNTTDLLKPISTATQTALNLCATTSSLANYCDLGSAQTLTGIKTFSNGLIASSITTTDRVNTSYIFTGTNNQIFYNMFSNTLTTTPTPL